MKSSMTFNVSWLEFLKWFQIKDNDMIFRLPPFDKHDFLGNRVINIFYYLPFMFLTSLFYKFYIFVVNVTSAMTVKVFWLEFLKWFQIKVNDKIFRLTPFVKHDLLGNRIKNVFYYLPFIFVRSLFFLQFWHFCHKCD